MASASRSPRCSWWPERCKPGLAGSSTSPSRQRMASGRRRSAMAATFGAGLRRPCDAAHDRRTRRRRIATFSGAWLGLIDAIRVASRPTVPVRIPDVHAINSGKLLLAMHRHPRIRQTQQVFQCPSHVIWPPVPVDAPEARVRCVTEGSIRGRNAADHAGHWCLWCLPK